MAINAKEVVMDRRTFLRKAAELTGISVTGISLSKLQIASVATGLSSLIGCSNNSVNDPLTDDARKAPPDPNCQNGAPYECDGSSNYPCGQYTCSVGFQCLTNFDCIANFDCSVVIFTCPSDYECSGTVFCNGILYLCPKYTCGVDRCMFVHDQGVGEP